jgi:hypothetical protein
LATRRITAQQGAFLRFELASRDARREKASLQEICRLYRCGCYFGPEDKRGFELAIAGLLVNTRDLKVVRWCLNAIARIGTKDGALQSVRIALARYETDPEIIAAAIAALAHLFRGQLSAVPEVSSVPPETRTLAAMQVIGPKLVEGMSVRIDIDTADADVLKLALIVIGLNRDIQNLFDPRHENGEVVRALGQHDDPIVRQYGVWAVIENDRLGLEHLGVPFHRLEEEPANVQAKLLQLGSSAIRDLHERQDFIWRGSNLESIDARAGLAQGLTTEFYDGLQEITVGWLASEDSPRVRLLLAEHMARFSDEVPTYEEEALRLAGEGPEYRERVLLGAEGRPLYGKLRHRMDNSPGLFDNLGDPAQMDLIRKMQSEATTRVLMLNASPDGEERIRVDIEARDLQEQLEMVQRPQRPLEVVQRFAVRPDQIQKELLANRPKILHFSGHGDTDVLVFETREGEAAILDGDVLADMVRAYGNLECVVLHACYSEDIARACRPYVQCVVGSTAGVSDRTAPNFSRGFYQGLAYGRPYRNAYDMGVNEVKAVNAVAAAAYIFVGS